MHKREKGRIFEKNAGSFKLSIRIKMSRYEQKVSRKWEFLPGWTAKVFRFFKKSYLKMRF